MTHPPIKMSESEEEKQKPEQKPLEESLDWNDGDFCLYRSVATSDVAPEDIENR